MISYFCEQLLKRVTVFSKFESRLVAISSGIFRIWNDHKVGILGTIALNLIMAILFFVFEIKSRAHLIETVINLDFDREYEINPPEKKEIVDPIFQRDVNPDEAEYEKVRNISVDATNIELNAGLTDEKKTDADEIYREAARAREQMKANKQKWDEAQNSEEANVPNIEEKSMVPTEQGTFKGPAVISYFLEGRKAYRLPVPAYKCEQGGQVVVDLEVNRDGTVANATIDASNSVNDECITNAAIRAALSSRFSASETAPSKQKGSITYLFVPQ